MKNQVKAYSASAVFAGFAVIMVIVECKFFASYLDLFSQAYHLHAASFATMQAVNLVADWFGLVTGFVMYNLSALTSAKLAQRLRPEPMPCWAHGMLHRDR